MFAFKDRQRARVYDSLRDSVGSFAEMVLVLITALIRIEISSGSVFYPRYL